MPEGFDRTEDAEASPEESLEDIREEFLEKYGEDKEPAEPPEEGRTENEGPEFSRHEAKDEPEDGARDDEHGEAGGRGVGDGDMESDSKQEGAESPETDSEDPEARLEEYREEAVEKYGQGGDDDAAESGLKSEDVPEHDEAKAEPQEEGESRDGPEVADTKEEAAAGADDGVSDRPEMLESARGGSEDVGAPDAPTPDWHESGDRAEDYDLDPKELEEFRERILEEYGSEGLGESSPEGQLYDLAREEMEGGRGSAEHGVDESHGADSGADRDGASETRDSVEAEMPDETGKQAPDATPRTELDDLGTTDGRLAEEVERAPGDMPDCPPDSLAKHEVQGAEKAPSGSELATEPAEEVVTL